MKRSINYLETRGYAVLPGLRTEERELYDWQKVEADDIKQQVKTNTHNTFTPFIIVFGFYGLAVLGVSFIPNPQVISDQTTKTVKLKPPIAESDFNPVGISAQGSTYYNNGVMVCNPRPLADCNSKFGPIYTNEVVGYAKIDRIHVSKVISSNGKWLMVGDHTLSLQLNAYVVVPSELPHTQDPVDYYFWVQNTLGFNTANSTIGLSDQIFSSNYYYMVNGRSKQVQSTSLQGGEASGNGTTQSGTYSFDANAQGYGSGISLALTIAVEDVQNKPILQFGSVINTSGSAQHAFQVYDNVGLNLNLSYNPEIEISNVPSKATSGRGVKRVDLVFGGFVNGENAVFTDTDIPQLGLYDRGHDGNYFPLNLVSPVSIDTGEGTDDLKLNTSGTYPSVEVGKLHDNGVMINDFPLAPILKELRS